MFRRLDALGGLLLKGMHYPEVGTDLYGINHAERIAPVRQRDLENPRAQALHRLGDIGFPAIGSDGEGRQADRCAPSRNEWNALRAALNHEIGRVGLVTSDLQLRMLSYLTTARN